MKVLEIGTYVSVAYAGMILAEQGHEVHKWLGDREDPVQTLRSGAHLWFWLNEEKKLFHRHAQTVISIEPGDYDVVIDNVRAETWERWGIDPEKLAKAKRVTWVSLRDDFDGRGFDAIAQARAWGDHVGYVPVYLGDTAGGLWLAFKALAKQASGEHGHFVIRQAACLTKLVEGELTGEALDMGRDGLRPPWDEPGTYGRSPDGGGVEVHYRGEILKEPFRSAQWRRENLKHKNGRLIV